MNDRPNSPKRFPEFSTFDQGLDPIEIPSQDTPLDLDFSDLVCETLPALQQIEEDSMPLDAFAHPEDVQKAIIRQKKQIEDALVCISSKKNPRAQLQYLQQAIQDGHNKITSLLEHLEIAREIHAYNTSSARELFDSISGAE